MPKRQLTSLVGQSFGRLEVTGFLLRSGRNVKWSCICSCGEITAVWVAALKTGKTKSCGCLKRDRIASLTRKPFGERDSDIREYWVLAGMKDRCYNKNSSGYKKYGARGIIICERWMKSFADFYADMGPRPTSKHSIERIDNSAGYSPENCRWATNAEQSRNRRSNRIITHEGVSLCLKDWADRIGITRCSMDHRLRKNWPMERIVRTPATKGRMAKNPAGRQLPETSEKPQPCPLPTD